MLRMKKKNKQANLSSQRNVTVFFGYSLFVLTLVAVTVSTVIPLGNLFFSPSVRHFNVALTLASFVAAAILPPLVSYILGDRSTHNKNKVSHHFNGVLFGIASYWLSLLSGLMGSMTISLVRDNFAEPWATVINGWPILAIILVMAVVATTYAHSRKDKGSVLQHVPYQIVLIAGMVSTFVYLSTGQYYMQDFAWLVSARYIVVPTAMIAISYKSLAKAQPSRLSRLTFAVVAVSIGFIAMTTAGQFISYLTTNELVPMFVGVIVWLVYLRLVSRTS